MSKRALLLYGGWPGHEPEITSARIAKVLQGHGYDVDRTWKLETLEDAERMASYDLITPVYTQSEVTPAQETGLLNAVKAGAGLAGWHGGMIDAFRWSCEYQFACGGQWVSHPGDPAKSFYVRYTVNITDQEDPITSGISDFEMFSEQYFVHFDPSNEVLATTTFSGEYAPWIEGTVMPVVWKRMYGNGRVFVNTLGHVDADFDVPEALALTERGLLWATR